MVDLSRRPSLDIFRVLWRCLCTVLLTPTTGGLRHRHQAFFCALFRSQDSFCLLFPAIKASVAGCGRYVQAQAKGGQLLLLGVRNTRHRHS
nr:MAG TPA: hypothetical protein [Caudoviricetes sp.]